MNLSPFQEFADVRVRGELRLQGRQLVVEFHLEDPQGRVKDSLHEGQWASWERADDLWKSTCFELFLGIPGESNYWEFNFSPAKEKWNLYSFDDYRRPQPPIRSEDFQLAIIHATKDCLKCELNSLIPLSHVEASLTAVIRTEQGTHYFATQHAGAKADFHLRKSFIIRL